MLLDLIYFIADFSARMRLAQERLQQESRVRDSSLDINDAPTPKPRRKKIGEPSAALLHQQSTLETLDEEPPESSRASPPTIIGESTYMTVDEDVSPASLWTPKRSPNSQKQREEVLVEDSESEHSPRRKRPSPKLGVSSSTEQVLSPPTMQVDDDVFAVSPRLHHTALALPSPLAQDSARSGDLRRRPSVDLNDPTHDDDDDDAHLQPLNDPHASNVMSEGDFASLDTLRRASEDFNDPSHDEEQSGLQPLNNPCTSQMMT